jgi:myosin-5
MMNLSLVQALFQSETQIVEEAKQAYAVEQAKNAELTRKLGDAEKKVDQVQDSVQRFVTKFWKLSLPYC